MIYRSFMYFFFLLLACGPHPSCCFSHSSSSTPQPNGLSKNSNGNDDGEGDGDPSVTAHQFFQSVPSHFSMVGFPVGPGRDGIFELLKQMAMHDACRRFASKVNPGYSLFLLASRCGAELWGGINKERIVTSGPDPHFFGMSRMQMKITKKLERKPHCDEAMFCGEARDVGDPFPSPDEEIYMDEEDLLHLNLGVPLEFSCPAYQRCGKELIVPSEEEQAEGKRLIVPVQMAAFAHEIQVWDSLEDYYAHNKKAKDSDDGYLGFADKSFYSEGLLQKADEYVPEPVTVFFTGHVLKAEEKINEHTGELYYWALVETIDDVKLDVVIHPKLIDDKHPPRVGSILQGFFFLSAHFFPDKEY